MADSQRAGKPRDVIADFLRSYFACDLPYGPSDLILRALNEAGYTLVSKIDPTDCYECGQFVEPDQGEQHGRAGMVHYRCLEVADARR